ncbi:MAG: hypothetical protein RBR68_14175 [Tenuifilaceae bacterium]|nr:hypothetical protein [Tenuifilaceae bacterium]
MSFGADNKELVLPTRVEKEKKMNEEVIENRPVEDDDDWGMDEIFNDDDTQVEDTTEVEETTETTETEVDKPVEKEEVDYSALLESLSKEIKYMDEEVKIADLEEAKALLQKGLDYDRKTSKLEELKNDEGLKWLDTKAKEQGMTRQEYLKAVRDFEDKQIREQEEAELQDMIDNGISEEIAKKVIETNRVAKELASERAKLKEQEAKLEDKKRKEAEDEKFLQAYPGVDPKSIPAEVFKDAEQTNLLEAYTRYKNQELLKEIEILKQNEKNKKTSPVGSTTEHGSKEKIDPIDAIWDED